MHTQIYMPMPPLPISTDSSSDPHKIISTKVLNRNISLIKIEPDLPFPPPAYPFIYFSYFVKGRDLGIISMDESNT